MKKYKDDMICNSCHKEVNSLIGGTTCRDCYIPFESRPNFFYQAKGNTEGRIKHPTGICGICGKSTFQPYPTGLWIHQEDNDKKDELEYSDSDHSIRPATPIELILLDNRAENQLGRGVGTIEWYGGYPEDEFPRGSKEPNPYFEKRGVTKGNHTECLIHRKYWIKLSGKKQKEIEKLIGSVKPGFDRRYGDHDHLKDFLNSSERINVLQFKKFLTSKVQTLNKNPKLPIIEYHFSVNSRSGGHPLTIIKETNLSVIPRVDEKIKIENKTYKVTNMWEIKHHSPTIDIVSVYLRK